MLLITLDAKPTSEELDSLLLANPKVVEGKMLTGSQEVITLALNLTAESLPYVLVYLLARIRANKHTELSYKGMKLKGLSNETIEKAITDLVKTKD